MPNATSEEFALTAGNFGDGKMAVKRGRGRPANRERNAEIVALGDARLSDNYEELLDQALEHALGRKPEVCPYHHSVLQCTHTTTRTREKQRPEPTALALVEPEQEPELEEYEYQCPHTSQARNGDAAMMRYLIDRVAGRSPIAGERQIKLDFVRRVASHVVSLFQEINSIADPEDRAQQFADGMTQMWNVLGDD